MKKLMKVIEPVPIQNYPGHTMEWCLTGRIYVNGTNPGFYAELTENSLTVQWQVYERRGDSGSSYRDSGSAKTVQAAMDASEAAMVKLIRAD